MPNARGFRFWKCEAAAAALVFTVSPLLFFNARSRPLAREEERLAHIAELAGGKSEAKEISQEREKNGTSGVHGGGYFAPHDTNNIF